MWFDTMLWLIALVVFIAVEAATTALVSIWFAVGAAAAMLASFFTQSVGIQLAVFAVVSAVTLGLTVPALLKRRAGQKPPVTNGTQLAVGRQGTVLTPLAPGTAGRVRVDGLDWQARAEAPLPQGAACRVVAADGAVLLVEPAETKQTV